MHRLVGIEHSALSWKPVTANETESRLGGPATVHNAGDALAIQLPMPIAARQRIFLRRRVGQFHVFKFLATRSMSLDHTQGNSFL